MNDLYALGEIQSALGMGSDSHAKPHQGHASLPHRTAVIARPESRNFLTVLPEEAYLTEKFGESYARYQSTVRRYL